MRHGFDGFPETQPGCVPPWALAEGVPRVGRYLLGPERGRGGMGRVHLAWDPMLKRVLALKLLHNADPMQILRLVREAQSQARIEHPHICRIYEVNAEGQPYIAMQYIQGRPLGEMRQHLSRERIVRILAEVADAVHAAHRASLIHRDLKPSNILVERLGEDEFKPYVLDFGLARETTLEDMTLSWCFAGTPAFTSPEQARSEPPAPSMDIYSLGATLFALLSGHPPIEAVTVAAALVQQAEGRFQQLRRLCPDIPKDLDTITSKCLELDPGRRYSTAFDLAEDLRRWLAGLPIHARPVPRRERLWRWLKLHRTFAVTLALGLAATATVTGVHWQLTRRAARQVEISQRFFGEIRIIESLLHIQRLLAPHDMRPALESVKARLWDMEAMMQKLGALAEGPGHHALGRGYLLLDDVERAGTHFHRAWSRGYRTPEVCLGLSHYYRQKYLEVMSAPPRPGKQAIPEHLRPDYLRAKALEYQAKAGTQPMDIPALAEAQYALLDGRIEDALRHCELALRQAPWAYEAHQIEAACWRLQVRRQLERDRRDLAFQAMERVQESLEKALAIGRSDLNLHTALLQHMSRAAVLASESGTPTLEPFLKGDEVFEQALTIDPRDPELWSSWVGLRNRRAVIALTRGDDPSALIEETRQRLITAFPVSVMDPSLRWHLGVSHWHQADALWRLGRDPEPQAQEAWKVLPAHALERAEVALVVVRHRIQSGGDPTDLLQSAESLIRAVIRQAPEEAYPFTVLSEAMRTRALWEAERGQDPTPFLTQGIQAAQRSQALHPTMAYTFWHLAELHAHQARLALRLGGPVAPHLQAARGAANRALQLRPDHYRTQLIQADIHLLGASVERSGNSRPVEAFRAALRCLDQAEALNPMDARASLLRAQAEILQASASRGELSRTFLLRAAASCQAGLRRKDNCAMLWRTLARVHLLRMRQLEAQPQEMEAARSQGLQAIQEALRRQPASVEAQGLAEALKRLQPGAPDPMSLP